jgi:hypothetical protein
MGTYKAIGIDIDIDIDTTLPQPHRLFRYSAFDLALAFSC